MLPASRSGCFHSKAITPVDHILLRPDSQAPYCASSFSGVGTVVVAPGAMPLAGSRGSGLVGVRGPLMLKGSGKALLKLNG